MQMAQITVNATYNLATVIREFLMMEALEGKISYSEDKGIFSSDFTIKSELSNLKQVMSVLNRYARRYQDA